MKQNSEWVSVSDRLPDEEQYIIWFARNRQPSIFIADLYLYKLRKNKIQYVLSGPYGDSYGIPDFEDCSYWMPLPKPPDINE